MTVAELIGKLQQLDSPDLEVWIPRPDRAVKGARTWLSWSRSSFRQRRETESSLVVIGDPGQECLGDRRN